MGEMIREEQTTLKVVTDDPPSTAEPGKLNPPPAGVEGTPSPDATKAATEAIAVGVEIGQVVGAATAAAADAQTTAAEATIAATEWQRRAEAAEAEQNRLSARLMELETPPAAAAETEVVTVEKVEPTPEAKAPLPAKPRGLLMKLLLG